MILSRNRYHVISVMTEDAKHQDVFILKGLDQNTIREEAEILFLRDKWGGAEPMFAPELFTDIVYTSRSLRKAELFCNGYICGVNIQ